MTGGALSFLAILLCLTLLFQWLFHCVLILNDTPLRICIPSKKTHSFRRLLFAYHLGQCKYFQLANSCHCEMFGWCFSSVKSFGNRTNFTVRKIFAASLLAQFLDRIREGSCPVISSLVLITVYVWGPLCIPARILSAAIEPKLKNIRAKHANKPCISIQSWV